MKSGRQSPFWNQDVVLACGLTLAGMMVLQSKLFAALAFVKAPFLSRVLDWKLLEWWPLLLIASGVVLWIRKSRASRPKRIGPVAHLGGNK